MRGHNDIQAIYNGIVWYRMLYSSGPLRTVQTAVRAADRSDDFGRLNLATVLYTMKVLALYLEHELPVQHTYTQHSGDN
jgi:hypothetical protein